MMDSELEEEFEKFDELGLLSSLHPGKKGAPCMICMNTHAAHTYISAGRWNGCSASVRWSKGEGWRVMAMEDGQAWFRHPEKDAQLPPSEGTFLYHANPRYIYIYRTIYIYIYRFRPGWLFWHQDDWVRSGLQLHIEDDMEEVRCEEPSEASGRLRRSI